MTVESLKIYDKLQDEIITLRIKPGEKISENNISTRFKVSRTPIRDVMKRLEINHLIEVKSHSGCYVTKVDVSSIHDAIFIRSACEYKVMKSLFNTIKKEDIDDLYKEVEMQKQVLDDFNRLGDKKLADQFFKLDNMFHKKIYKLADASNILIYLNHDFPEYQRYRYLTGFRDLKENETLFQIHKDLVTSLDKKDAEFLEATVNKHNYSCLNGIDIVISKHQDYFINN